MRPIDADALVERTEILDDVFVVNWTTKKVQSLINAAPTIDAAPVVRCKVCKYWCRNAGIADSPNGHCFCHDIETNGQDFCSYGERRSE